MVRVYLYVWLVNGDAFVPVRVQYVVGVLVSLHSFCVVPVKASVGVTFCVFSVVGVPKVAVAVPVFDPSGVKAAVFDHVAFAVFVTLPGFFVNVQVYESCLVPVAGIVTAEPPVTLQVPPPVMLSVTVATMDSQLLGFVTVILPDTAQPLSLTPVCLTATV